MVKYHYVVLTCPKRWYLWVLCYQTQMGSSYCLLVCMWVDRYTIGSKTTRTQKKWSNHIGQEQPKEFTQWFASKAWENGVALKWRHFIAKSQCPNSKKKLLNRVWTIFKLAVGPNWNLYKVHLKRVLDHKFLEPIPWCKYTFELCKCVVNITL